MNLVPQQIASIPVAKDWVAISKTLAIEIVFIASSAAVITGHSTADALQIAWATGLALGVLRVTDVLANVVNVRSFLGKPDTGVVPQAMGTPLISSSPVPVPVPAPATPTVDAAA